MDSSLLSFLIPVEVIARETAVIALGLVRTRTGDVAQCLFPLSFSSVLMQYRLAYPIAELAATEEGKRGQGGATGDVCTAKNQAALQRIELL